jgi:hypothetical protein
VWSRRTSYHPFNQRWAQKLVSGVTKPLIELFQRAGLSGRSHDQCDFRSEAIRWAHFKISSFVWFYWTIWTFCGTGQELNLTEKPLNRTTERHAANNIGVGRVQCGTGQPRTTPILDGHSARGGMTFSRNRAVGRAQCSEQLQDQCKPSEPGWLGTLWKDRTIRMKRK